MDKRRKRNNLYLLVGLIALSFLMIFISFSLVLSKPEITSMVVRFQVAEGRVGIDTNSSGLIYGIVPPGSSGQRYVNLRNDHDYPVEVTIYVTNPIADVIESQPKIYLGPGEEKQIMIVLRVPGNYSEGSYEGEVFFETSRV